MFAHEAHNIKTQVSSFSHTTDLLGVEYDTSALLKNSAQIIKFPFFLFLDTFVCFSYFKANGTHPSNGKLKDD